MPAPDLPIELQLLTLDRVHFPHTFHSARERTLFLQAASLVHRSWTADAQARLPEHVTFEIRWPPEKLEARLDRLDQMTSNGRAMKRLELWWSPKMRDVATLILGLAFRFPDLQELSLRRAQLYRQGRRDPSRHQLGPSLDHLPQGLRFLSLAHIELEMADLHAVARLPHLETLLLTDLAFQLMHWFHLPYPSLRILGVKTSRSYFSASFLSQLAGSVKHLALVGFTPGMLREFGAPSAALPSNLATFLVRLAPEVIPLDTHTRGRFAASDDEGEANLNRLSAAGSVRIMIKRDATQEEIDGFDLEEWTTSVEQ